MYEGIIREKPTSKEEARQFIKGPFLFLFLGCNFSCWCSVMKGCDVLSIFAFVWNKPTNTGYSGSHGGVIGSVIVSNLKTGVRRVGWDKAEVLYHTHHIIFLFSFPSHSFFYKETISCGLELNSFFLGGAGLFPWHTSKSHRRSCKTSLILLFLLSTRSV